ncbi:MAG: hypothetical protein LC624_10365 [Halobacteriales archaeon]|nr:hypothetical protein [Halobacteriales archaeon]
MNEDEPGIARVPRGKGFVYRDAQGKAVRDPATLARVRKLAIPPAWRDVWVCPDARGHVQATGRDARGRKQYRYHDRWREVRDRTKYARMVAFGRALPRIRARVRRDLRRKGLPREKVLATLVRLLDETGLRVGNEEYARDNGSFGLTTLRERHAKVRGDTLRFRFRGKVGKMHEVDVQDPRVARILRACQDLPGQDLFQCVEGGEARGVGSADVNGYLREAAGADVSAKDFRTWTGTLAAFVALREAGGFADGREAQARLQAAVQQVADKLGNTVAIARKSYIHPGVLTAHLDGSLQGLRARKASRGLSGDERAVLHLLRERAGKDEAALLREALQRSLRKAPRRRGGKRARSHRPARRASRGRSRRGPRAARASHFKRPGLGSPPKGRMRKE